MKEGIVRLFERLRKAASGSARASVIRFGDYELDWARHELRRDGRSLSLPPKALKLLIMLARAPGVVFTRDEIATAIWENSPPANIDAGINNLVRKIRVALDDNAERSVFVESVAGRGYRFIAPVAAVRETSWRLPPWWWLAASMATGVVLTVALLRNSYGTAIVAFWVGVLLLILGYPRLRDGPGTRVIAGLYVLAAMAYTPSAWTVVPLTTTVVNMGTLGPAVLYPFVTGLKFIPIFVLIAAVWVFLRVDNDAGFVKRPLFGRAYVFCGVLFLLMTASSVIGYSGDYTIWKEELPGRWDIGIGYAAVFAINVGVWTVGYQFFRQASISNYRRLFGLCAMAYLLVVIPSVVIDGAYNQINLHYLDKRRSDMYVAANPDAIRQSIDPEFRSLIGPDLQDLLNDPEFEHVLRNGTFHRQDFDEPFQLGHRAVMFGYKVRPQSTGDRPVFAIIRFPEALARALRIHYVGREE